MTSDTGRPRAVCDTSAMVERWRDGQLMAEGKRGGVRALGQKKDRCLLCGLIRKAFSRPEQQPVKLNLSGKMSGFYTSKE